MAMAMTYSMTMITVAMIVIRVTVMITAVIEGLQKKMFVVFVFVHCYDHVHHDL